jgi:hypothetical protein
MTEKVTEKLTEKLTEKTEKTNAPCAKNSLAEQMKSGLRGFFTAKTIAHKKSPLCQTYPDVEGKKSSLKCIR